MAQRKAKSKKRKKINLELPRIEFIFSIIYYLTTTIIITIIIFSVIFLSHSYRPPKPTFFHLLRCFFSSILSASSIHYESYVVLSSLWMEWNDYVFLFYDYYDYLISITLARIHILQFTNGRTTKRLLYSRCLYLTNISSYTLYTRYIHGIFFLHFFSSLHWLLLPFMWFLSLQMFLFFYFLHFVTILLYSKVSS